MAERRMFAKTIIDSDAFLDMPTSARLLYYDLGMRADDDGFVNSPKKIMRMIGATQDDLSILALRKFIIPFENGIVVIKHWKIHNYIRKDTYSETKYLEQKERLELDENNSYRIKSDTCDVSVDEPSTQDRLGKDRLDKVSIDIPASEVETSSADTAKASKHKYGEYKNVLLKDEELQTLKEEYRNWEELIKYLDEYIEMKGYKAKSHYLAIRKWVVDAVSKNKPKQTNYNNYEKREYGDLNKLYSNKGG